MTCRNASSPAHTSPVYLDATRTRPGARMLERTGGLRPDGPRRGHTEGARARLGDADRAIEFCRLWISDPTPRSSPSPKKGDSHDNHDFTSRIAALERGNGGCARRGHPDRAPPS